MVQVLKGKRKSKEEWQWRLVARNEGQVFADRSGMGYRDPEHELFLPWGAVTLDGVASLPHGGLGVRLNSDQPGRSYVISRLPGTLEDEDREAPYLIEGQKVRIPYALDADVDEVINTLRALRWYYYQEIESQLKSGGPQRHAAVMELSHLGEQRVVIDPSAGIDFPSFCPFSGDDCETVLHIEVEGGASLPWLGAEKAKISLRRRLFFRRLSIALPVLLCWYWIWSYWDPSADYLNQAAVILNPLWAMLLIPLTWHLTRSPLSLRRLGSGKIECRCRNSDYFQALVDLNVAKGELLPWRADLDAAGWRV